MMKIYLFIILLLTANIVMAQSAEERMMQLRDSVQIDSPAEKALSQTDKSKVRLGMNIGTGYAFSSAYGSGMNFYAAPTLSMPVTDRLSVHGGIVASTYYPVAVGQGFEQGMPSMYSSLALFAAASYRMNDRLILHGAGYKRLVNGPVNTPFSPYPIDNFSFGATFKLGDNVSIGASISVNSGNGYYNSPGFGHPGSYFGGGSPFSPFYW